MKFKEILLKIYIEIFVGYLQKTNLPYIYHYDDTSPYFFLYILHNLLLLF